MHVVVLKMGIKHVFSFGHMRIRVVFILELMLFPSGERVLFLLGSPAVSSDSGRTTLICEMDRRSPDLKVHRHFA